MQGQARAGTATGFRVAKQATQPTPSVRAQASLVAELAQRELDLRVRFAVFRIQQPGEVECYGNHDRETDAETHGFAQVVEAHVFACAPDVAPVGEQREADAFV